jgi:CheY-like chemotaxis protein
LVDDQRVNRILLGALLRRTFDVVEAENGAEAVDLALAGGVDLVLMDIQMPVMDGYEATRAIKKGMGERFLPIVLMTAGDNERALAAALDAGGDEILTKPISPLMVDRRLRALLRFADTYREVKAQKDELGRFREGAERDYALAGRIFDSVQQQGCLFLPSIEVSSAPMETFSGDIAMATLMPPSRVRLFLGDFTGHGLAAAVGVIPVSEVFYRTARVDMPIDLVLAEMNAKVLSTLPRGMFLAAFMAELDASTGRLTTWNGGLPPAYVLGAVGGIRDSVPSTAVPLGILPEGQFEVDLAHRRLELGERLFIYSDGVIEANDAAGELFGSARLEEVVGAHRDDRFAVSAVEEAVHAFQRAAAQSDDITIIELRRDTHLMRDVKRVVASGRAVPPSSRLRLEFCFTENDFRGPDPMAPLRSLLERHPALAEDFSYVDTVVSELFLNGLDHGVLGLSSSLKDGPDGFERFHAARRRALEELENARITVAIDVAPAGRPEITVRVQDSGGGFLVPDSAGDRANESLQSHGRGLQIVRGLCQRLEFFDGGRAVRATLPFRGWKAASGT